MNTEDRFLIGTMMILGGIVGMTSIKSFWTMVIGAGTGLTIISLVTKWFKEKN